MNPTEIEQIRARHRPEQLNNGEEVMAFCRFCKDKWPCDASLLQAALSEAEAELAAMKKRFDLSDERCDSCHQLIETGFVIHDDEGATWCEDCWQP